MPILGVNSLNLHIVYYSIVNSSKISINDDPSPRVTAASPMTPVCINNRVENLLFACSLDLPTSLHDQCQKSVLLTHTCIHAFHLTISPYLELLFQIYFQRHGSVQLLLILVSKGFFQILKYFYILKRNVGIHLSNQYSVAGISGRERKVLFQSVFSMKIALATMKREK